MSNYEDDQSEDGELARSPIHQDEIDFSFSDEMDTTDSLDIRPPQAKIIGQSLKDRSSRHGKSSRHKDSRRDKKHSYRDREKLESRSKKDSDMVRVTERDPFHNKEQQHYRERERDREVVRDRDRDRDREYVREKEVYRERDREREREREHYREKEMVYREKDIYRDKEVDVYREKETYRYKEPYREKDVYRERERRIEKEAPHSREIKETTLVRDRDRDRERERYMAEAERGNNKESSRKERGSGDKELEDLRSRLLSKRKSKEQQQQQDRREEHSEARKAHLERRDKILQADRETSRRKEEGRAALEERRSRHSKRQPSPTAASPSPSPPSTGPPAKKSRPSVSPPALPDVVTVSDNSDHEQHEDGEHNSASSSGSSTTGSDRDEDTEGSEDGRSGEGSEEEEDDDRTHDSRDRERERDRDSREGNVNNSRDRERVRDRSRSRSPLSDRSDISDGSPRGRRSRSRTRSRSRSRSHSFSPPRDANGDEIHHIGEDEEGEKKPSAEHGEGEDGSTPPQTPNPALPPYFPAIQGCRSVEEFQCLNRIEEGTYGVVYRAKDKTTDEIVALKRLKMEKEKEGFPITSLREINTLLKGQHPNIVTVREIVVGSNMDKIFIVMDYVEHDLKGLMETMRAKKQVFLPGEVKCLMQQLLKAVDHLHDNWILHRDLKTSNLLLSHKGILKVGDFGLAREYGSPLKNYTPIVVTLWYRAPELLLGARTYSTPIDIWSVGCIFAEFLMMQALFPGKSEVDQLNRIFKDLGTPNETIWPGWSQLSGSKAQWADHPGAGLRGRVGPSLSDSGLALLQGLLTYDPTKRLQASTALAHNYFKELPQAIDPAMFPTWPAKSEGAKRQHSPKPPPGGDLYKQLLGDDVTGFHMGSSAPAPTSYLPPPTSFSLKF